VGKKKRVAIIPALLGSTRIPDKNLILVDGYPMVFYTVRACQESGVFDEIYINSEHSIFEQIAKTLDVKFYSRKPERGGSACEMSNKSQQCNGIRCQTHDHFLFDFMQKIQPCYLNLVHTTSPLLEAATIRDFMALLVSERYDSLFSVEEKYTETLYNGRPLNFSFSEKIPTQTLSPVQMISWALSGWNTASFIASYLCDDPEEKGPTFCGKTGFFPLDRVQALDADTWLDLHLVEASLQYRRRNLSPGSHRFTPQIVSIEHNLRELIARDGVTRFEEAGSDIMLSNLQEIKRRMGEPPWLYLLVHSSDDQVGLICQRPGEGARKHFHVTHDEWWLILEGVFEWRLDDGRVITAKEFDVVLLPQGTVHSIVCTSSEPGIRLACGARNMEHIYVK
jgi:CMP-N-acetylneuraminic acid synthetase/mannose-6-phosphate isomerase-like protein (cupin superfamily)